jgi:YVTN family beta-propeller protein
MKMLRMFLPAAAALCALVLGPAQLRAEGPFHVEHVWKVGGVGFWDYMTIAPHTDLLYITHGDRVDIVNTSTGKTVGAITGLHGIHCVVFSSDGVHGYITDGGADQVAVFDRRTNKIVKRIAVGNHPDGAVFEPVTQTVWAFNGRGHSVSVISTKTNTVIATIQLPGKPEFPVADGRGSIFDNIESKNAIVHLDAKTLTLANTWPVAPCEAPSGLAIDPAHRRLFSVCHNQMMAVVNDENGKVVATPAIGDDPDAARFSAVDRLAFSSNGGNGTLTVVHEDSPDHYTVVQNLATEMGARTMALAKDGAHLYLVTAKFGPRPPASPENPHRWPSMVPGSFRVIVVGK